MKFKKAKKVKWCHVKKKKSQNLPWESEIKKESKDSVKKAVIRLSQCLVALLEKSTKDMNLCVCVFFHQLQITTDTKEWLLPHY